MVPMGGNLTLTQLKAQVRHQLISGRSGEMDTIWQNETLIKGAVLQLKWGAVVDIINLKVITETLKTSV